MHARILKRTGAVLLAAAMIGVAATVTWRAASGLYLVEFDAVPAVAGIVLLRGNLRAALWVRSLTVFILAATIVALIAVPLSQPLDLTVTEIRLDPADFASKAAASAAVLCLTLWVTLELGRPEVRDAIASAGIKRWDMRIPAQAGGGLVALV